MNESVAAVKEADAKKRSSPTHESEEGVRHLRDEPDRQLGSLGAVISNISRNGAVPSAASIATQLSSMHTSQRAPVLLALQQTHGNRYVQRVVSGIQAKLKVRQPGDIYEQKVDRVADEVMRMPDPRVQRQEEEGEIQAKPLAEQIMPLVQRQDEPEEEEEIQTKQLPSRAPEIVPDVGTSSREGGQPLPDSAREFFEPRFGYDFSRVRVHTDAQATGSAQALNARAFTMGRDIVFGAGEYALETNEGKRLLAHELTHVLQQGWQTGNRRHTLTSWHEDVLEQEADRGGRVVDTSQNVCTTPFHAVSAPIQQRQKSASEETRSQRLRQQALTIIKLLSKYVADADKHGYVGITLTITHNGEELVPGFEMHKPRRPRPSGTTYLSAATAERRYLKPNIGMILQSGPGHWQIVFGRDERGRMVQHTMHEIVPRRARPPQSEREELKALGITRPRERAAKMFKDAKETLKEAGVMLAGIALKEIVLWIVGGAFLRVIGLLGRGAARAFPNLLRAIRLKRAGDIAKAANRLGKAEAAEFSELMRQAQRGVLPKAKKARLNELMDRVETFLGKGSRRRRTPHAEKGRAKDRPAGKGRTTGHATAGPAVPGRGRTADSRTGRSVPTNYTDPVSTGRLRQRSLDNGTRFLERLGLMRRRAPGGGWEFVDRNGRVRVRWDQSDPDHWHKFAWTRNGDQYFRLNDNGYVRWDETLKSLHIRSR